MMTVETLLDGCDEPLSRAKKSKSYHHGDLRAALVDAALGLIKDGGVEALTLRAAARQAGVTHAAPYRHFEDKNALLAAVAQSGFEQMADDIRRAQAEFDDAGEQMRATGLAYAQFAQTHCEHFALMFGRVFANRDAYPDLQQASETTFALLLQTIIRCQAEGILGDADPRELALTAWSMTHGFASLIAEGQLEAVGVAGDQVPVMLRKIQDIMYQGLGAKNS